MRGRDSLDAKWRSILLAPDSGDALTAQRLIDEFRDVEQDRSDLGRLAGPRYRDEAGYRWLPYKEAFSPGLVRAILDSWPIADGLLLDPFAGGGTSLLVASERGLESIGVELLPYSRWAGDTVVRAHTADVTALGSFPARCAAGGWRRGRTRGRGSCSGRGRCGGGFARGGPGARSAG